jgi:hypothetical protein
MPFLLAIHSILTLRLETIIKDSCQLPEGRLWYLHCQHERKASQGMPSHRAQGKVRRQDLVSYEYALRLRTKL